MPSLRAPVRIRTGTTSQVLVLPEPTEASGPGAIGESPEFHP
jgi:hypothetical protein